MVSKKHLGLLPVLALAYLAWHAFAGGRSIPKFFALNAEVAALGAEVGELKAVNRRLEQKVAGLREETLDLQSLEVSSRRVLGLAAEGELLVPLPRCDGEPSAEWLRHEC